MADQKSGDSAVQALRHINQAWVSGNFDELGALVDPAIVCATPGFGERIRGREAYVEGHREFVQSATIHDFTEGNFEADVVRNTAVVTYRYEIDYERSGKRYESTGRDLYVLRLSKGRWLAIWRTMLEIEEREAG
jgi:hypothetical protein